MIGQTENVQSLASQINQTHDLIAYSGPTQEGSEYRWIDIHHRHASKGSAIEQVIGHHNEDGVARFLRTRFNL